jgi:hypothetical protein
MFHLTTPQKMGISKTSIVLALLISWVYGKEQVGMYMKALCITK